MRSIPQSNKYVNGVKTCKTLELNDKNKINNADTEFEAMEFKAQIKCHLLLVHVVLNLGGIYGLYLMFSNAVKINTTIFFLAVGITSGFGVSAGGHRLWSHRSYKARTPLRLLLALLFACTGHGDLFTWVVIHRVHHKYTETVADPVDVRRGLWFAHYGWMVLTPHPAVLDRCQAMRKGSQDLHDDIFVKMHEKYIVPVSVVLCALISWIPVHFWDETLANTVAVTFFARITLLVHMVCSVNSIGHSYGQRPYNRFVTSADNKILNVILMGEGSHNYHHAFPWDYRASDEHRWNPTTRLIELFAKFGWAYDLKTTAPSTILKKAKLTGDETISATVEE